MRKISSRLFRSESDRFIEGILCHGWRRGKFANRATRALIEKSRPCSQTLPMEILCSRIRRGSSLNVPVESDWQFDRSGFQRSTTSFRSIAALRSNRSRRLQLFELRLRFAKWVSPGSPISMQVRGTEIPVRIFLFLLSTTRGRCDPRSDAPLFSISWRRTVGTHQSPIRFKACELRTSRLSSFKRD
jgi:hypothetical protein